MSAATAMRLILSFQISYFRSRNGRNTENLYKENLLESIFFPSKLAQSVDRLLLNIRILAPPFSLDTKNAR